MRRRLRLWMTLALAGAVLDSVVAPAPPADAAPPAPASMSGDEFVQRAGSEGIDAQGLTITGDVDLRDVDRVGHLVACRDCTITGSLRAADVVFERVVDLSGHG